MTKYFEPVSFKIFNEDRKAFGDALCRSFRETGFAVVSDHSVDDAIIENNLAATKAYFALPENTKLKYDGREGGGQRGYTAFGTENAKGNPTADQKEFWHTGRELPDDSPYRATMEDTPSVSEVPEFDTATRALYNALDDMGQDILRGVALHLNLPENWFEQKVNFGNSILRLLHYPPQLDPPPEGSVRAAAHGDINVITLLLGAEEAGLQALHRSGKWLDVNPPKGALVINCGDMLSRLTAGVLPSTIHRVLNPKPERAKFPRYSTPFFLHFNQDVVIDPLPQCVAEGGEPEPAITAQDFLMQRLEEIGLIKKA